MSVRVSSWVWQHSGAAGNDLLLLLALADVADDNGHCWPSVGHLADKTKLSRATVQRRLKALRESGRIVTTGQKGTSNVYGIVLDVPQGEAPTPPQSDTTQPHFEGGLNLTPVSPSEAGGASPVRQGVPHKGEALHVIDTPPTRHSAAKRGGRIAEDFTPSPASLAWAQREYPGADLKRITEEFVDYWLSAAGRTAVKLDWDRTWKNRIRDLASRGAAPRMQRQQSAIPHYWQEAGL